MNNKNFRFYVSGISSAIVQASWNTKTQRPGIDPEELATLTLEYATKLADTVDTYQADEPAETADTLVD